MVCMICGKKMFSLFDNRAALCDECVSKAAKEKKIILKAEGVMW